jgi:hypothetical protein
MLGGEGGAYRSEALSDGSAGVRSERHPGRRVWLNSLYRAVGSLGMQLRSPPSHPSGNAGVARQEGIVVASGHGRGILPARFGRESPRRSAQVVDDLDFTRRPHDGPIV